MYSSSCAVQFYCPCTAQQKTPASADKRRRGQGRQGSSLLECEHSSEYADCGHIWSLKLQQCRTKLDSLTYHSLKVSVRQGETVALGATGTGRDLLDQRLPTWLAKKDVFPHCAIQHRCVWSKSFTHKHTPTDNSYSYCRNASLFSTWLLARWFGIVCVAVTRVGKHCARSLLPVLQRSCIAVAIKWIS